MIFVSLPPKSNKMSLNDALNVVIRSERQNTIRANLCYHEWSLHNFLSNLVTIAYEQECSKSIGAIKEYLPSIGVDFKHFLHLAACLNFDSVNC